MIEPLTKRQSEALIALQAHHARVGYFQTCQELGKKLHCSKQAAHVLITCLESKGYLKTYPGKHRAIRLLTPTP